MLKLNNMLENVYKQGRCGGGGEVRLKIAVAIFLTPCY